VHTPPAAAGCCCGLQVPPGHVWLEGDNLIVSRDSREYGPVPLALVRGRAVAQIWPEVKWLTKQKA
jgi:inner membrane protease subunit 1